MDSLPPSTGLRPTIPPAPVREEKPFLDAPVVGKARDSLVYDVRNRLIFHYQSGDLTYQDNNLKADFIIVNAATKEIYGTGVADSTGFVSRPEFVQAGANYTMDTLLYNLDTKKALVQGVATKDGEGFLLGRRMKKMPDNTINIAQAKYTTCDRVEHPHFYIAMTKARVIPGKKIITGPAYFVMEDVPIYFLGIPGGFFPISTGPTAGLIMPRYGEESRRGFYLQGGGYYFTFGDHFDLRLTADLYTLGSWGVQASSRYVKRYKYSGNFSGEFNQVVMGEKNTSDYSKLNTFSIRWSHSQDPKATPGQTFSASVNYSTSGQKQLGTTSLSDHLNTNTTSNISYSRKWDVGQTYINLTAAFSLSTNSSNATMSMTLPDVGISVGRFSPFRRKVQVGKQRWYEKITMGYNMKAQNSTGSVKESEFFSKKTLREMQNGVTHNFDTQTSFNLLGYINFSPSFNYREAWNFQRQREVWDPTQGANGTGALVLLDREYGFYRTYGWDVSGQFSTKLYGMFEAKPKPGKTRWLQAIRHVITPTFGVRYAPDFNHPRYGFVEHVQSNANGDIKTYNPNIGYGKMSPGGPSASITFSISNQLEIKVSSRNDSTGMKKIKLIEQFSFNSSYDFLKRGDKEFPLAAFPISLRTGEIFKGFALQLNASWDPYLYEQVDQRAVRVPKFNIGRGKFGRITRTSWSFGKTFNSPNSKSPDPNSINGSFFNPDDPLNDPYNMANGLDPATRRLYMTQRYYDFQVPWSFTFNYNINYNYTGLKPEITQSLTFNGNVTLTEKWGFTFQSGYDFTRRKLSTMQFSLARDLHCWDMSFQWTPMGGTRGYSFHIGIKSGMLADIKYDKSSIAAYDNFGR